MILMCWLVYASAYLGRYSYNSNITLIESAFGVSHAESGLVTTFFFFAYGAGQVLNGIFCKRYPKRSVLSLALAGSSVINLAVFFGIPFNAVKYLWMLNGALQSVLWSSLVSVLAETLDARNLKKAIIAMSTTTSAGTLITYGLSSLFALSGNFRLSFGTGAAVMLAVALCWYLSYGKLTAGAPQAVKPAPGSKGPGEASNGKSALAGTLIFLLSVLAVFAIVDNLVKDGLHTWVPSVLKETYGLADSLSIVLTLILPVLGIFGAMFASLLHRYLKNFLVLAGAMFGMAAICLLAVVLLLKTSYWAVVLVFFGLVVLLMHGVNNVIVSMTPMYLREKIDSGKTAGILNGFCYVGSTISSYGLGAVADLRGWDGVFHLLLIACAVPAVFTLIYVSGASIFAGRRSK